VMDPHPSGNKIATKKKIKIVITIKV
jgi:hypothetical protein